MMDVIKGCDECASCNGYDPCIQAVEECTGRSCSDSPPYTDTKPYITIEISQTMLYGIFSFISLLLIINIFCLCYFNCCTANKNGNVKNKYSKVQMIASSDDEVHP